jgi:hypothetical protein
MAGDWIQFYYVRPQPERFVEEVRRLAAKGLLGDEERGFPTIVFLSCIIAANPSRFRAWFDALSDLSPSDMRGLRAAADLSRVPEARACFSAGDSEHRTEYELLRDIVELPLDHPVVLDALWARYFATGDTRAVRRVVAALADMSDCGAAKAYAQSRQTPEDDARALRDGIFQAAAWSLECLVRVHEPLKRFCGELVQSGDLEPNERCNVAMILAKIDPQLWNVEIDTDSGTATITWVVPDREP